MDRAIIVFAKEPVPGQVKTRLMPPFSAEEATTLYQAMVRDVLSLIRSHPALSFQGFLATAGESGPFLKEMASDDFELVCQEGPDLGARMEHALKSVLSKGFNSVLVLGSDSPSLPSIYIEEAFDRLDEGASLVLGPATDGGYYLIGVRGEVPSIFGGIRWSQATVLTQTLVRARESQIETELLPYWYDVDDVMDLQWLAVHAGNLGEEGGLVAPATLELLKKLARSHQGIFPCL